VTAARPLLTAKDPQKNAGLLIFATPKTGFKDPGHLDFLDNANNVNYNKFVNKGKNTKGGNSVITWRWTNC
jgi:hypothetical protein